MSGREKAPLTGLQQILLGILKGIEEAKEFYFTGGAALSYVFLRHRMSEVLDFFTAIEPLIQQVSRKFKLELEKGRLLRSGYPDREGHGKGSRT